MCLEDYQKSANVHNYIKKELKKNILKPGVSLHEITRFIEDTIKEKMDYDPRCPLKAGIAFPVSLSVNKRVAHYTLPLYAKKYILQEKDILKIDYGIHKNGYIIDSAFSYSACPDYQELLKIGEKTTDFAVSLCKIDTYLSDIGVQIEEYVQSKEIIINNNVVPLTTIKNLFGHNIKKFQIHGGKMIPSYKIPYIYNEKIKVNEVYALEPFISTGDRMIYSKAPYTMYELNKYNNSSLLDKQEKQLLFDIKKQYGHLTFCDRYLKQDLKFQNKKLLHSLIKKNSIKKEASIYIHNGLTTQFESNVYILSNKTIRLT